MKRAILTTVAALLLIPAATTTTASAQRSYTYQVTRTRTLLIDWLGSIEGGSAI